MDLQRAVGRCEAAGRFPQLALEFSPETPMGVSRAERFIPLSILSAQVMRISSCVRAAYDMQLGAVQQAGI